MSTRYFLGLGEQGLATIRAEPDDQIHFNIRGANALAGLVADELPKVDPRFAGVIAPGAKKPVQ